MTRMSKIIIISPNVDVLLSEEQLEILRGVGEVVLVKDSKPLLEVSELYEGTESRIVAIDPDFCEWSFPNDVIDKIPNLQAICLQTTSFSWVDLEHTKDLDIPVTNLRGFSSVAVAEWATMLVLALARRVPLQIKDGWKPDYEKHRGLELRGKTAAVIGLGRIGTAVAENLAGLGMDVQYWSRSSRDERFRYAELEDLVRSSDVIVSTIAHTKETETLLSDELVKSMKPTALLVDMAHPIYNTELVLQMAAEGKLGGYALEDEKNSFGHYAGNVWNGPALAWSINESMSKNAALWVESILNASKGDFPTKVN